MFHRLSKHLEFGQKWSAARPFFQLSSQCFDILMKHCLECLIYYFFTCSSTMTGQLKWHHTLQVVARPSRSWLSRYLLWPFSAFWLLFYFKANFGLLISKVKSPSHFFRSRGQSAGVGGLGKMGEGVGVNWENLGGFWEQRFSIRH